jgi:hypothetical protein
MGMRSDSPRVAAASEARRSSSLSTSGKRVSLEAEAAAYDSPTLLPRRSLVFPPHLNHAAAADPKLEQPAAQDEDFSSSKSSSGECECTVIPFVTITATVHLAPS